MPKSLSESDRAAWRVEVEECTAVDWEAGRMRRKGDRRQAGKWLLCLQGLHGRHVHSAGWAMDENGYWGRKMFVVFGDEGSRSENGLAKMTTASGKEGTEVTRAELP